MAMSRLRVNALLQVPGPPPPIPAGPPMKHNGYEEVMVVVEALGHEKREEILRLAAMYGCLSVHVFGSVAEGGNKPHSDVDFLVDLDQGRGLLDLGALLTGLEKLLRREVDLGESGSVDPC